MKLVLVDDCHFLIYLNTFYTKDIDFSLKEGLEAYFKKLFLNLKENYNMPLSGYYNITIYQDQNYGALLEIEKEDLEYFDYFGNEIDMRIAIVDNINFLYKIKDVIFPCRIPAYTIYTYKDEFYLELNSELEEKDFMSFMEWVKIIYGEKAQEIKRKGKIWKEGVL